MYKMEDIAGNIRAYYLAKTLKLNPANNGSVFLFSLGSASGRRNNDLNTLSHCTTRPLVRMMEARRVINKYLSHIFYMGAFTVLTGDTVVTFRFR